MKINGNSKIQISIQLGLSVIGSKSIKSGILNSVVYKSFLLLILKFAVFTRWINFTLPILKL